MEQSSTIVLPMSFDNTLPGKQSLAAAFHNGIPFWIGGLLMLLPVYATNAGLLRAEQSNLLAFGWLPLVATLMLYRIPAFSGRLFSHVMSRSVFLLSGLALLIGYITLTEGVWTGLALTAVVYVLLLPLSAFKHSVLSSQGKI